MFWEKESFWAMLVGVLVPILNHFFGWGFDVASIAFIVTTVIALIVGSKWETAKIVEAEARIEIAAISAGLYKIENKLPKESS